LNYVTALVAQRAADSNTAIALYQNVKASGTKPAPPPELLALLNSGEIDKAIETLSKGPIADTSREMEEQFPPDTSETARRARPRIEADMDYAFKLYETLFSLERPRPTLHIFKSGEPNAFWVPTQNSYYAPADTQYIPDVTYHDVAHVFIESLGKLSYDGQSGAIIESYADICASWVSQKKFGQSAQNADWTIGSGFVAVIENKDPQKDRTPIRSMKAPGTASKYDGGVDNYSKIPKDQVEPHMASGVPNKAFYEAAARTSTDKAIAIWIAAMPQLKPTATIPDLAIATMRTARTLQGDQMASKVMEAWTAVGLPENVAESLARSNGTQR
jgi:hypothetical protein